MRLELATLRRVAGRSGRPRELSRVVAALEAERASLAGTAGQEGQAKIAPDLLRAVIEVRVREMRAAFEASLEEARRVPQPARRPADAGRPRP